LSLQIEWTNKRKNTNEENNKTETYVKPFTWDFKPAHMQQLERWVGVKWCQHPMGEAYYFLSLA
jgi:hypothetical protein